jgi:hypothetical protein
VSVFKIICAEKQRIVIALSTQVICSWFLQGRDICFKKASAKCSMHAEGKCTVHCLCDKDIVMGRARTIEKKLI